MNPADIHRIVGLKFFNTHGTEITPGSDVVGEYVQNDFTHIDGLELTFQAGLLERFAIIANHCYFLNMEYTAGRL